MRLKRLRTDRPSPRRFPFPERAMLALMACLLLATCAPGADLSPAPPYDTTFYQLGVDDQVRIMTFGEDQLSSDYRVSGNGTIAMPLIGSVKAAGLTTDELARSLEAALTAKQILLKPSVTVEVTAYRSITILGEVVRPGQFPYQPGMTMLTAVAAAGGFTYRAIESRAYVVRQEGATSVIGKLEPQDYVKPGDALKIYQRLF